MKKIAIILFLSIAALFMIRMIILKKPSTEILYTVIKENLVETVRVAGTFNKTASDEEKALAYLNYQNAINALKQVNKTNLPPMQPCGQNRRHCLMRRMALIIRITTLPIP
ncbi:hypothetical protein COY90_01155 [Candidatus Roizmanbacteria bacterium CG_4_10_14_0_8_um_filter_39_9]|uniref:Uncharacterized protein n=1 Tax=Candidatus Roizmanbacteria bacterium CG_4_10_14_0_8_um_filter_39_9 TaxID=1974829 RepID=A0A2M7QEM2_9BACT|nr:MAG: hypothetical protein COY90_01155 [Candidatus Roizmanbacteria bacterium CG_4_10_14_0_8_um_filter_39_9]